MDGTLTFKISCEDAVGSEGENGVSDLIKPPISQVCSTVGSEGRGQ